MGVTGTEMTMNEKDGTKNVARCYHEDDDQITSESGMDQFHQFPALRHAT